VRAGKPQAAGQEKDYILSNAGDLLREQREGTFTYRTADCCSNPVTCLKSCFLFPLVNNINARELKMPASGMNCSAVKTKYREMNQIPGLKSDDNCAAWCICTYCCVIAQIRNELDETAKEKNRVNRITNHLNAGMVMERT
jgi:hypothetical protein